MVTKFAHSRPKKKKNPKQKSEIPDEETSGAKVGEVEKDASVTQNVAYKCGTIHVSNVVSFRYRYTTLTRARGATGDDDVKILVIFGKKKNNKGKT